MYVCSLVGFPVLRRIGLVGWVVVEGLWVGVVLVWRFFGGFLGGGGRRGLWGSWVFFFLERWMEFVGYLFWFFLGLGWGWVDDGVG